MKGNRGAGAHRGSHLRTSVLLGIVIAALSAASVHALPVAVIDQDTTGSLGSDLWDDNDSTLFQVFTAGRAGLLDSIELTVRVAPQPGAIFELARLNPSFDPSNPTSLVGDALISVGLPVLQAGALAIDVSAAGIQVSPGDRFVFSIEHDDVLSVAGATGYAGGEAWFQCNAFQECIDPLGPPNTVTPSADSQLFPLDDGHVTRSVAFRTRVVAEPLTAVLVLSGGSGLLARRRRSR